MLTGRRSVSGPGGLSSNAPASSRKSTSAPSSTTKRANGGSSTTEDGSGLIVTRGLQEILENDRKYRRPSEAPATEKGPKGSKTRRRSSGQAPNFIICYLCGRQFGSASIDIHRPQCYLKKLIEWERGDPAIRGPKPLTPEAHEKMMKTRVASATAAGHPGANHLSGGAAGRRANDIELYNQIQMDAFNETSLAPCPNCGRTFLPDRLQIHLRSCKPGHTARPVHRASAPTSTSTAATAVSTAPAAAAASPPPRGANGVAKGASPAAKPSAAAQDRPIRASGAYAVPDSAGPEDVPPRSGTGETAIRARGSYAIPEDARADNVPSQAPSAQKPSRGGSLSNTYNAHRGQGDDSTEEAELRESVLELEPEEVKPPSPRADTERRLSSVAILRGDPDMTGSSAPNRPASMEPSALPAQLHSPEESISVVYALSQSRGREHAAGSRPRKQGSASAPRTAPMPELISEPRDDGTSVDFDVVDSDADELESLPVVGGHGRVCQVVECTPGTSATSPTSNQEQRKAWTPKKIPLNNVSRFKNVESRLKQQREAELAMFVPCQYCGRTFVPERIQKHEDCCAERNKPPARRSVQLKSRPTSAPASGAKHAAKSTSHASSSANNSAPNIVSAGAERKTTSPSPAAATAATAAATPSPSPAPTSSSAAAPAAAASSPVTGRAKFCGGCGVRVSSENQKFCTECGFKL